MTLELKIIPPIQWLISAGVMYGLSLVFPLLSFSFEFSLYVIILLIIMGSSLGPLALYNFHQHRTTFHPHTPEKTRTVVDSGVFAYSRNPMYLALVFALLALGIYLQNYGSFIVIPLFIVYLTRFQIIPEEKMLTKLFPTDYPLYCERVNRWL